MQKLKILNTREKKEILDILKDNYGFNGKLEGVLFQSRDHKLFYLTGGLEFMSESREKDLRIAKAGLYIGEVMPDEIMLSIDGSQLIGPDANKNILKINDEQLEPWVKGEDFELESFTEEGYFIVKHKNDFLGCARIRKGKASNLLEKNRRIKNLNR